MFSFIIKLFKSLNNNSHPGEIAHGVSCALLLGFLPKDNLLWYIVFIFCAFLRINKSAYGLMIIVFSFIAPFFDNFFDFIGYSVLTFSPFDSFFSFLIDIPFVSYTNFNNTIVMGALICGLVLYFPMYFISRLFVKIWRHTLAPKFKKLKIYKAILKLPLLNKISNLTKKIEDLK